MSKFNKIDTLALIRDSGIVPLFCSRDAGLVKKVVKACYDAGIRSFEFINRCDNAHAVFKETSVFVRRECPEMSFGAGTVLDAATAAFYLQAGADFLVSPAFIGEVSMLANRRGVPYSPGCGTITEIMHAQEQGCDLVKIFPAGAAGGPDFVKNVLATLPWSMLMATGSVEPTEDNLKTWAKSGVTAVGMGSKLFPAHILSDEGMHLLTELCRNCLKWFKT